MKRFLSFVLPFVAAFAFSAFVHASDLNASGAVRFSGDISPSQLTAQTDNWNPTGLKGASVIRVSTDASRDLTGLAGGYDGRLIIIHNVGAQNLVLKDASGSSSAANRFALTGDVTLGADAVAALQYDGTTSVWRLVGGSGSGGIAHSSLTGLTSGDDHTQYALLAGRSGGQSLIGSTAASQHLVLQSTSHATEGEVQVKNSDTFRVYDPDNSTSIQMQHAGAGGVGRIITSEGAIELAATGSGTVQVLSTGGTQTVNISHDNTDATIATSAGDLIISPATGLVGISQTNPTYKLDILGTGTSSMQQTSTSAGALGPVAQFVHDSASPADADDIARFNFKADDDIGTSRIVGRWEVTFQDVTSTTMDSAMYWSVMDNVNAGDAATIASLTSLGVWTDASLGAGKTFEGKMDDVLTKVKNLRIEKYRSSRIAADSPKLATAERHYSCTAEDFYAIFGLGRDPNIVEPDGTKTGGIAPKDAAFLALDCIQKLIEENDALKARITALEAK